MTALFKVGQTVYCGFHQSPTVIERVFLDFNEPRASVVCRPGERHDPMIDGHLFPSEEAWLKYEIKSLRKRLNQYKDRMNKMKSTTRSGRDLANAPSAHIKDATVPQPDGSETQEAQ